ncbi:MAG: hypothetical protein LBB68_02570 [Treponema sp.]|nr:hypothetical protein [Treponema sp.]
MKNLFFIGVAVIALAVSSCATASPPIDATTQTIGNPYVSAQLRPEDYTVLGRVTGTGKITYNAGKGAYTGDTLKYGVLGDEIGSVGAVGNQTTTAGYGLFKKTTSTVSTPGGSREIAIGNATYDMIEKAKALGADAVIFVTTLAEASADAKANTSTTMATVSAVAIKLK